MIRFGPWRTTLGLATGFGALVASLLWNARGNRAAQRLLALLLLDWRDGAMPAAIFAR